jgi:osmoprotectant transport system permease protein
MDSEILRLLSLLIDPLDNHLVLLIGSLVLGILASIPLALLCLYNRKIAVIIITFANFVQAIPSFAIVALVVPLLGIGFTPAIFAIFLRSLLPIIKNTYIGLKEVDTSLIEFAQGIGLTPWQILRFIRLPNAYPAIFAGIKFAAILANSIAILTAIIGSGGYGEIVFSGLSQYNINRLLLGVIPVILIAIFIEFFFSYLERKITPIPLRKEKMMKNLQ